MDGAKIHRNSCRIFMEIIKFLNLGKSLLALNKQEDMCATALEDSIHFSSSVTFPILIFHSAWRL